MLIKVQKEQNLWDVIIITKIFISTYETIKLLKAKKSKIYHSHLNTTKKLHEEYENTIHFEDSQCLSEQLTIITFN